MTRIYFFVFLERYRYIQSNLLALGPAAPSSSELLASLLESLDSGKKVKNNIQGY